MKRNCVRKRFSIEHGTPIRPRHKKTRRKLWRVKSRVIIVAFRVNISGFPSYAAQSSVAREWDARRDEKAVDPVTVNKFIVSNRKQKLNRGRGEREEERLISAGRCWQKADSKINILEMAQTRGDRLESRTGLCLRPVMQSRRTLIIESFGFSCFIDRLVGRDRFGMSNYRFFFVPPSEGLLEMTKSSEHFLRAVISSI